MWESLNNWIDLDSGDSSAVLQYNYSGREYYFIIDTLGVAYDNSGIDELVFRANTSIVVSSANAGGIPAMRFYILYN